MIGGCVTTVPTQQVGASVDEAKHPQSLAFTLVMLVWGVAGDTLRDIISGFLDEVRFD